MDKPFAWPKWQPTAVYLPERGWVNKHIRQLAADLRTATRKIKAYPYEPKYWISRSLVLKTMMYPELAAGDAHKALRLVQGVRMKLVEEPRWRLGYRSAFWMYGEDEEGGKQCEELEEMVDEKDEEGDALETRLNDRSTQAHNLIADCVTFDVDAGIGTYYPRAYPWMENRHLCRSDKLIDKINEEFLAASKEVEIGRVDSYCRMQRHAFGDYNLPDKKGREILGVFATQDIEPGTVLFLDETRIWGCAGLGKDGTTRNLNSGIGCSVAIHPQLDDEDASHSLHWIRDRAGKNAPDIIALCRMLTITIDDEFTHPLDHPLIARLTATYRRFKPRFFHLDNDIVIPTTVLQQWGVDVFANHAFDTWVIHTVHARMWNNCWDGVMHTGVSPLFSMFNHSCEPNVGWRCDGGDFPTVTVRTERWVGEGEQLFVCYDGFVEDKVVAERRERLTGWFDAECRCGRCVREAKEGMVVGEGVSELAATGVWDTAAKPVFPEDALNADISTFRALGSQA